MNHWRRVLAFSSTPRALLGHDGSGLPGAHFSRRRAHGWSRGADIPRNGAGCPGALDRGRRLYATTPAYVLSPKNHRKTQSLVKIEGAGSEASKPLLGANLEAASPTTATSTTTTTVLATANKTSNNALLMAREQTKKIFNITPSLEKQRYSSTEYNSWLKSDGSRLWQPTPPKASTVSKGPESIDLLQMPLWFKTTPTNAQRSGTTKNQDGNEVKASAITTQTTTTTNTTTMEPFCGQEARLPVSRLAAASVPLSHAQSGTKSEAAKRKEEEEAKERRKALGGKEGEGEGEARRPSSYSSVPTWKWETDFNHVLQQLRLIPTTAESVKMQETKEMNANANADADPDRRRLTQIVIDFEKQRWLQLPPKTHFLRPNPVKLQATSRSFSGAATSFLASSSCSFSSSSSSSSSFASGLRRFSTVGEIRTLDEALAKFSGTPKGRYFVVRNLKKGGASNVSSNNDNNFQSQDRNNNSAEKISEKTTLNEVIAMIVDPRSAPGGPRPEVIVRPPNVPPPKAFVKVNRVFFPVKDDVQILPTAAAEGEIDEHGWWRWVLLGGLGLVLLYPLLGWYLSEDACPIIIHKEKDDPAPMVGKYYTSLPVKMKDLKKAEVVMGRPQKDHMKTWSDIEKNWNTPGPNAPHLGAGAGAAPAEGNARFGAAGVGATARQNGLRRRASSSSLDEDEGDDEEEVDLGGGSEVKLRRDVNLRRNMRLEIGRTDVCKDNNAAKK